MILLNKTNNAKTRALKKPERRYRRGFERTEKCL
jgi:hypothetical protein